MRVWATFWATYDTARLVGAAREGPADCGALLSVRWRGLPGVSPVALPMRRAVRPSCGLDAENPLRRDGALPCGSERHTVWGSRVVEFEFV